MLALRLFAFLIALAGFIDPALTTARHTRPLVAVVAAQSRDSLLAVRVADQLGAGFTIVNAPLSPAAATVLVGHRLPDWASDITGLAFALVPASRSDVRLARVDAPARAPLNAHVPIVAAVQTRAAAGRKLVATLQRDGLIVERVEREISSDAEWLDVSLGFVPINTGAALLRVSAALQGTDQRDSADVLIDVSETKWSILFFDRRPSWMATFVRRALERDPRFQVNSRTLTSRNISTAAGRAPAALQDHAALQQFDAIVVGAPDALDGRDVAGLDGFMRTRGGGVLLLLDRADNRNAERLTRISTWQTAERATPVALRADAWPELTLLGGAFALPARLPAGTQPVMLDTTGRGARNAVVWRSATGAGQLVVSGVLDAWKYRDPAVSRFDAFWQTLLAELAAAAPSAVDIQAGASVLEPGEATDIAVTLRDLALAQAAVRPPSHTAVSAWLETPAGREPVRLWPDAEFGRFHGSLRAPAQPGLHRLVVVADDHRAEHTLAVLPKAQRASPDETDLVRAWAAAHHGSAWDDSNIEGLRSALRQTVPQDRRREIWHPMRSPWWLLPFTLALGLDWWLRRRRGLR